MKPPLWALYVWATAAGASVPMALGLSILLNQNHGPAHAAYVFVGNVAVGAVFLGLLALPGWL